MWSATLLGDEIGDRTLRADACAPCGPRSLRQREQPAPNEIVEHVLLVQAHEPRNRLPSAGDHNLGAVLDAVEMLAEPVVELANADLIGLGM